MELKKHVSSLALAALMISQVGTTMLPIFDAPASVSAANNPTVLPDALYQRVLQSLPSSMSSTKTLGANHDPFSVRGEANSKLAQFGLTQMYTDFSIASALRAEQYTIRAICNLHGYEHVRDWDTVWTADAEKRSNFSTCGDNHHGVWTGNDITNGSKGSACGGSWTSYIVCGTPLKNTTECNDGEDNDGDGDEDDDDFSCDDDDDNDEENPKSKCQNGLDDDNDQLIDFPQDPGCTNDQDNDEGPQNLPTFSGTKTADVGAVRPGGFVTYTVTFQNTSNVSAPSVRIVDSIPGSTTFESNGSTAGCSIQGTQVTCPAQTLAPGQGIQAFIRLRVNTNASCGSGRQLSNNAILQKTSNNQTAAQTSTITTRIDCAPLCQNGIDDDGDGAVDLADFSCGNNPNHNDEELPKSQCQNGMDDDGDDLVDTQDPRCHTDNNPSNPGSYNKQDNDESPQDNPQFTATKTSSVQSVQPGGTVTYTIAVRNTGTVSQSNIRVIDNVPSGMTFVSAGSTSGCSLQGSQVVCNAQTYSAGQTINTVLKFQLASAALCGGNNAVTNTAAIQQNSTTFAQSTTSTTPVQCAVTECNNGLDDDGDNLIDTQDPRCHTDNNPNNPNSYNPQDTDEDPQDTALFTMTKTADVSTVQAGGIVTYTIAVRNTGNVSQSNVRVVDNVPGNVTFVPQGSTSGCVQQGATIFCQPQTVNPNQTVNTVLKFQVNQGAQCGGANVVSNIATLQANNTQVAQSTTVQTPVRCVASNVTLASVDVNGCNVTVNYTKNFTTCAHLLEQNGTSPLNIANSFCNSSGPVTVDISNFRPPFAPGLPVKLCNGNNYGDCSPVVTVTGGGQCNPQPQLTVTKTADLQSAKQNDTITYTIQIRNDGQTQQQNIRVTDNIPGNVTYVPNGSSGGCVQQGATVFCPTQTINPGQTTTTTLKFRVNQGAQCGGNNTVSNVVSVQQNNVQVAQSNQAQTPVQCVTQCSDTADNDGDGMVDSVDPGCSNPTDDDESDGPADIGITMTGPQSVVEGQNITYNVTVRNNGPDAATRPFAIRDVIPNGFVFQPQSSTAGCTQQGNDILCGGITLGVNQQRNLTLVFTIPEQVTVSQNFFQRLFGIKPAVAAHLCGQNLNNTVNVVSSQSDPNTGNNQATVTTLVTCQAPQFSATKTADVQSVLPGGYVTYTIATRNNGTSSQGNVKVVDNVPGNVTFVSQGSTAGCVQQGATIFCPALTYTPGQTINTILRFQVNQNAQCGGSNFVSNIASIQQNNSQIAQSNQSQVQVQCAQQNADVSISKSAPASLDNNDPLTFDYNLNVVNSGPSNALGVTVTDQIPPNFIVNSVPTDCTANGNSISCTTATMVPMATKTYRIGVAVAAKSLCNQTTTNTASVTTTSQDPNQQNNTATAQTSFTCPNARLYVTKDGPPTVNAGGTITYNFTLQNTSTVTANGVNVYDYFVDVNQNKIVPAPFTFVSASGINCQFDQGNARVSCSVQTLTPNQLITFSMTFQTPSNMPQLCNSAFTNKVESIVGTNQATLDTDTYPTVLLCPAAQFSGTKTPDVQSVQAGGIITYTINFTNTGPTAQQNIRISDNIPANTTFVPTGSTAGCTQQGTAVVCQSQTVNPNQTIQAILKFQVNQGAQCGGNNTVLNTATVQQNNVNVASTSQVQTAISCTTADLQILLAGPQTVMEGQNATYTATVTNNGPSAVTSFTFKDAIPNGFVFQPQGSTNGCTQQGTDVVCTGTTLNPGQPATFTLVFSIPVTVTSNGLFARLFGLNTAQAAHLCGQNVTNTVTITNSSHPDPNGANNSSSVTTQITCQPAVFSATKSANVQSTQPGGVVNYTINVTNTGQSTQQNIRVTDTVPANMTFVPATSTPGCTLQGNVVSCTPLSYIPNQTISFYLSFQVNQNAQCGGSVFNSASVLQNATTLTSTNVVSTSVTCPQPQFSATKQGPTSVTPGEILTYLITITNIGQASQQSISLFDVIPSGLTFVAAGSTAGCAVSGNGIACQSQTFTPGQSASYTLRFTANQNIPCNSTVQNQAQVMQGSTVVTTSNQTQTTVQCVSPKLDITKTAPPTVNAGGTATYTYVLRNTSTTTTATQVEFVDFNIDANNNPLNPPLFTFVSSSLGQCSVDPQGRVYCSLPDLAPGQTVTFTLTFNVPSNNPALCNQVVRNQVDIWTQQNINDADWDKAQTTVLCPQANADISVQKTGPASAPRGGNVVYSLVVSNAGPGTATNVSVTDNIPQGMSLVSVTGAQCINSTTQVICSIGSLLTGSPVTIQVTLTSPSATPCTDTPVTNTATVTATGTTDPNNGNNFSQVQTTLTCPVPQTADLIAVKSGPATVVRGTGSTITYTINVTNAGPASATNVSLTDVVPTGLTFVSANGATCAVTGNQSQVGCSLNTLAFGQTVPVTLTFNVPNIPNCTTTTLTNVVNVSSQTPDSNTANNQSTFVATATCPAVLTADVGVVKLGQTTAIRGEQLTYTFIVTNFGPGAASSIVLTDQLPAGLQFISSSGGQCAVLNNTLSCTVASLPSGQSSPLITATFLIPSTPSCMPTNVSNTASITTASSDPNSANNSSTVTTLVNCPPAASADLVLVKTGPAIATKGTNVTYQLTATNIGPSVASNVLIKDVIQTGLTFVSATIPGGTCFVQNNEVQCTLTTLALNQSAVATVTFLATAPAQGTSCTPSSVTNTGTVSSGISDPNNANNSSSVTTQLLCPDPVLMDLSIVKIGPATIVRGNLLTYNIQVTSSQMVPNAVVVVTDNIPAGLTFNQSASTNGCSLSGTTAVSCSVPGSAFNVTLAFNVPTVPAGCTTTTVTNTATVRSQFTDPNMTNNTSFATTTVNCPTKSADLSVTKTGPTTVSRGANIAYVITVNNAGPDASDNVVITDTVPAGLEFASATGAVCTVANNQVTCNVGTVNTNASSAVTLNFTFAPTTQVCAPSTLSNTAILTAGTSDPNTANNQSTATTTVTCPTTDLSVTKTGPSSVVRGSTIAYAVTVTNNGPGTATSVVVRDQFPFGLTFTSASGATCTSNGTQVDCTIATLTSGQSIQITLNFSVPTITNCTQLSVSNTATVTSATQDTSTSNNTSAAVTTNLTCGDGSINDISVYKTDNRSTANTLDRLRYSVILTNISSTTVNNLTITDNVPYGLTILTVSDGGTVNGQQVRWTNISVPANSSRTLTIDAEVRSDVANGTVVRNTVDVNGKTASDDTTIQSYTYNPPPPPYYNPPPPPYYTPPPPYYTPPPVYYPPNNPPPVYYPPTFTPPPPQVIFPQTGTRDSQLYAKVSSDAAITKVQTVPQAPADSNGFNAVFYATLLTILAVGSAAASRFLAAGI